MQLFTAVNLHVPRKAREVCKARPAVERLSSQVFACMPFQLPQVLKRIAANFAAERPFVGMDSHVVFQITNVFKLLVTNVADKRRFASVHAHVLYKFAGAFTLLVANCASKPVLTCFSIHLTNTS